jgi:hypothetical protein
MTEAASSRLAHSGREKLKLIDGGGAKRVTDEILGFVN